MKNCKILVIVFAVLAAVSTGNAGNLQVDFDGQKSMDDIKVLYYMGGALADLKPQLLTENIEVPAVSKGYVGGADPIEWVSISGGKFMMGTDDFAGGFQNARPVHEVAVNTFEMSKTHVTVEQYAECVLKGKCTEPERYMLVVEKHCNWGDSGKEKHPVNCVTWNQAEQYAKFKGARLPSESEWEYAATSGGKSQKYPWGNNPPTYDLAVMESFSYQSMPVCSKPAGNTEQGLCDMAGNITQWMQDRYKNSYIGAPSDGAAFESEGSYVVTRGGSFRDYSPEKSLRADFRGFFIDSQSEDSIGFRLVKAAEVKPVEWVSIPGGKFMMGTAGFSAGFEDTKPAHEVVIKPFEMFKTDVTVAQYAECVNAGKCTTPGTGGNCNWGIRERQKHPVNCVDWSQANQYAEFRGARLPSEAEWEYAARSGGKNYNYPWGDSLPTSDMAVMNANGTMPVCSKLAGNTEQGLCDMAGNVYQWVQDRYQNSYVGAPVDGEAFEITGPLRVLRGSKFNANNASLLRTAYRFSTAPGYRYDFIGFRIAKSR